MPEKTFLALSLDRFRQLQQSGNRSLDQLTSDDQVHWQPDPESNSIAIIVKHMHGNMRSRFTDFLTSDGEKPDRDRDEEFIDRDVSLQEVQEQWNAGWKYVFDALEPLTASDLDRIVYIRREELTVMEAIIRQLVHFGNHVGQIVYIAKHLTGSTWQTLSIARGKSKEFFS